MWAWQFCPINNPTQVSRVNFVLFRLEMEMTFISLYTKKSLSLPVVLEYTAASGYNNVFCGLRSLVDVWRGRA